MIKKTLIERLIDADEKIKKLKESEKNYKENLTEFKKVNPGVIIKKTKDNISIDVDDHAIKWPIIREYLGNPFVRWAVLKKGVIYEASKLVGNTNSILRIAGLLKKVENSLFELMPSVNPEFAQYLDKKVHKYSYQVEVNKSGF